MGSKKRISLNNIWTSKMMTNKKQIAALRLTIRWFKKQIKPRDCGWMYTTIDGLKYRIKELRKKKPSFEESFFANRKKGGK